MPTAYLICINDTVFEILYHRNDEQVVASHQRSPHRTGTIRIYPLAIGPIGLRPACPWLPSALLASCDRLRRLPWLPAATACSLPNPGPATAGHLTTACVASCDLRRLLGWDKRAFQILIDTPLSCPLLVVAAVSRLLTCDRPRPRRPRTPATSPVPRINPQGRKLATLAIAG